MKYTTFVYTNITNANNMHSTNNQNRCNEGMIYSFMLGIIMVIMPLIIGCVILIPQIKEKSVPATFSEAKCIVDRNMTRKWNCCATRCENCLQNNITIKCQDLEKNLTVGICDNDYYCCDYRCDTCTGYSTEVDEYECNCQWKAVYNYDGEYEYEYICETCYYSYEQEYTYDCNCGCRKNVTHRQCNVVCGTCSELSLNYYVYVTNMPQLPFDQTVWVNSTYGLNVTIPGFTIVKDCWYHIDKESNNLHVEWQFKDDSYNPKVNTKLATGLFIIIGLGIIIISLSTYCVCK